MNQKSTSCEQQRRSVVEKMWLHHYNNILLEKGLITETQHRKMAARISSRVRSFSEGA